MDKKFCSVCGAEILDGEEYYDFSDITGIENDFVDECCIHERFKDNLKTNYQED